MNCNEQHLGEFRRPNDPDRITRLANVMYWAGCVLALIWLAIWLHDGPIYYHTPGLVLAIAFGGAAVIWMIGRAIRYVWIGK
jgi:hypothetical protein